MSAHGGNPRIGTAYDVALRSDTELRSSTSRREPAAQHVLSFRLRRVGADGELLAPLAVELWGGAVTGTLAEGDLVQLPRTPIAALKHGGAVKLTEVTNLTTGTPVVAGRPAGMKALTITLAVLCAVAAVGIILVVVFLAGMLADF